MENKNNIPIVDFKSIFDLAKKTPLETRFQVSMEMTFIQMLVELGFIEDRPWIDDNEDDNRILKKIIETCEKESKQFVKEIKKWQSDGMPEKIV